MAPQPPLHPPEAFTRHGALPPWTPSSSNPDLDQALTKAAFDGDIDRIKMAVRSLAKRMGGRRRAAERLDAVRDGFGMGLLHSAALNGGLPMCRYLLEDLRLDVDAYGPLGETALTIAIGRGNVDVVRYLLNRGADTEKLNVDGCTPLHLAAGTGSYETVELLLSKGANVDAINLGGTALHVAAGNGRADIVKLLLDHHADHKIALSATGYTALVVATIVRSLGCVKLLLEAGADVDGIGKETPLIIAASVGLTDILKCLVLAGANPNVRDSLGQAPIETAARFGRREDVEILFPVTSRIPGVCDWSVDGIMSHVQSVPPAKKAMLASAKSEAHEAFRNGNYLVAARIYKEAMNLEPGNASLLSNRSLCWLRFGNAKKALKDAEACRMMRPDWPKACYRQGAALMLLKEYEKACGAFLDGLKLEPGYGEIEEALREALESLKMSRSSPGEDQLH